MNRREFLSRGTVAAASLALPDPSSAALAETPGSYGFIFITDTHIEPELHAAPGCAMCFRKARATAKVDFAIQGGDDVFDALGAKRTRADHLYDLYARTEQNLGMKVYHAIGNHDAFGVYAKSGIARCSLAICFVMVANPWWKELRLQSLLISISRNSDSISAALPPDREVNPPPATGTRSPS